MTTAIYLARQTELDDGEVLWWSNESGFGGLDMALVFTEEEQRMLKPPLGGEWVRFEEASRPALVTGQILPGQELDGGTVIASVIINDTDYDETVVMALLLMPTSGWHYRLVEVMQESRRVTMRQQFENIVPAVEAYQESGGDY